MTTVGRQGVLVTGFGPFTTEEGGRIEDNPSAEIAARVAEVLGAQCRVLSVSYEETPAAFVAALADLRPRVWVGVGLAANRRRISIESVGLNVEHGRDGTERWDATIDPDGPVARRVSFDAASFVRHAIARGEPVELSHHAGTYLCNRVLFDGLAAEAAGRLVRAAFVHVPPVNIVAAEVSSRVVAALVRSLEGVVAGAAF